MFKPSSHIGCGNEACHGGVHMSDDIYFEGYERDVVYPPCICHPKFCKACSGTGIAVEAVAEKQGHDDCTECNSGWLGDCEHPDHRYSDPEQWKKDMAEWEAELNAV